MTILVRAIDDVSSQGPQYLRDVRDLESNYGVNGTFSYSAEYLDFEQYFIFTKEASVSITLSLIAVVLVILLITFNWKVTLMVLMCVILVDMFLVATIHYSELTFNSIVVVHVVVAVGFAVDYSAHIAHAYLIVDPPKHFKSTNAKRAYKAKTALSRMGSSVFHGAFATFLAINVLIYSKSYIYTVFYRLWLGMIAFGVANGFILLPVVLSYFGPVDTAKPQEPQIDESSGHSRTLSNLHEPEPTEGEEPGTDRARKKSKLPEQIEKVEMPDEAEMSVEP